MLHRRAGTRELVEVHGTIESSSCLTCGAGYPLAEVRERLDHDPLSVPHCDCGEPLKPDVVLFGEWLPEDAIERAYALAARADVLLCVGTSLEVHPVAQLPGITRGHGGAVAVVTQGPTPWDDRAAVKLDGDVVAELEALVAAL
jgi:NAD-dependent deacetylase